MCYPACTSQKTTGRSDRCPPDRRQLPRRHPQRLPQAPYRKGQPVKRWNRNTRAPQGQGVSFHMLTSASWLNLVERFFGKAHAACSQTRPAQRRPHALRLRLPGSFIWNRNTSTAASLAAPFRGTGKTTGGTIGLHRPRPPPGAPHRQYPAAKLSPKYPAVFGGCLPHTLKPENPDRCSESQLLTRMGMRQSNLAVSACVGSSRLSTG